MYMLLSKYGECGILIGADKNKMDILPILNTNLKLKQVVNLPTRRNEILDICITNFITTAKP